MAALASYENIKAWQKSHLLALEVYKATNKFPREEAFGLVSQLRRAAISIPTNIAEGYARQNQKVFGTFLDKDFTKLGSLSDEVSKPLWGHTKEVKNR